MANRKYFVAAKYIDYLPGIIQSPDFASIHYGNIELIKCFKDNIFISIKLDVKKSKYYVATVFDVKQSKIDSYVRIGRSESVFYFWPFWGIFILGVLFFVFRLWEGVQYERKGI